MEDRILEIVLKDEISWKAILFGLVKQENMNPWDINISLLTKKYVEYAKTLKQTNLQVSGKVVLAAAILLRIKSVRLVSDDLQEFDKLLTPPQSEEEFYDSLESELKQGETVAESFEIHPRIPQPRKRKVSIFDLVRALEKALEVKQRRLNRIESVDIPIPEHHDITIAITELWHQIQDWFSRVKGKLTFASLLHSGTKKDKIDTFVPLLHLAHQKKLALKQEIPFGEIEILEKDEEELV